MLEVLDQHEQPRHRMQAAVGDRFGPGPVRVRARGGGRRALRIGGRAIELGRAHQASSSS
ncbi:hypothetical protein [Lysobacter gummosus]|uniref:hypothetical protein n=1 Tax=Lysobacter gummosus TaxID=262324 RepID=UPI0036433A15